MKKILLGLSFLAFQTTVCRAQIKNLFPKKNKIYLSDKAAAEYEKIQKLGEQFIKQKGDNMTDADWEYLAKLGFDETRTDYWQNHWRWMLMVLRRWRSNQD